MLETGSFESRSAIFFVSFLNNAILDCVDTRKGSDEHDGSIFENVKKNFDKNISTYLN